MIYHFFSFLKEKVVLFFQLFHSLTDFLLAKGRQRHILNNLVPEIAQTSDRVAAPEALRYVVPSFTADT